MTFAIKLYLKLRYNNRKAYVHERMEVYSMLIVCLFPIEYYLTATNK